MKRNFWRQHDEEPFEGFKEVNCLEVIGSFKERSEERCTDIMRRTKIEFRR